MSDPVNPQHYKIGDIELIDVLKMLLTTEEYRGLLKGSLYQYIFRCEKKNGVEDAKKGRWYIEKLIESLQNSN